MAFWPKVHYRWKEPLACVRAKNAKEHAAMRWWFKPLMALITGGMLLASWYIARFNPEKHPPSLSVALMISLLGGPFLVCFLGWMFTFCPSFVRMTDSRILRSRGNIHRETKYMAVRSFGRRVDGEITTLVLVEHGQDREIVMAVPNEISVGEVSRFLIDRQVQPRFLAEAAP